MTQDKKPKRRIKTHAEKPKRENSVSTLTKQVHEIQRLLLVWPDCPAKIVDQFIESTLGVTPTRLCLQEAKENLGLHQPEYSDLTLKKKALAEFIVCDLARHHGVGGLKEEQFCSKANNAIFKKFGEKAHSRLIKSWVAAQLILLKPAIINPDFLNEAYKEAKEKIEKLGLMEEVTGQLSLL